MCAQGCRPDAIVYNAIIDALWQTGVVWAQAHALQLYRAAVKQGYFRPGGGSGDRGGGYGAGGSGRRMSSSPDGLLGDMPGGFPGGMPGAGSRPELNLHALTAGVAMLSLYSWLTELRELVTACGAEALPATLAIVTDAGSSSKEQSNFIIKEAVAASMAFWGAPFKPVQVRVRGQGAAGLSAGVDA